MSEVEILELERDDLPRVVDVLCDAFVDYPVMRYVLRGSGDRYPRELRVLVEFFAMARISREEPILGTMERTERSTRMDDLSGVALVSFPGPSGDLPELDEVREAAWRELGAPARQRYEAFGGATATFAFPPDRIHLNMIGTRARVRGRGHGRKLLEGVCRLAEERPEAAGVSLTTEVRSNVALYQHFGFRVVGHQRVSDDLETWGMFKEVTQ